MHGRAIIICILLNLEVLLAGTPGYLATVGPADLRFEVDVLTLPEAPLPPLPPVETSQLKEPQTTVLPATDPTETVPGVPTDADATPAVTAPANTAPLSSIESSLTNTQITPQMLVEFFKPDAPGVRRGAILVPNVGFSPANPPQSSSAIFTQPNK